MAEAPKRTDRRTRIAQGPAPMGPPVPKPPAPKPPAVSPPAVAPVAEAEDPDAAEAIAKAKAKSRASLKKKTQMIMGVPPPPSPITGKTQIPSGPISGAPTPAPRKPSDPIPQDFALPSEEKTVVGPAPVPKPDRTVVGPAPAPPVPTPVQPTSSSETMEQMMDGGGIFDDLETGATMIPDSAPDDGRRQKPPTMVKRPPRPNSGPAPRATPDRDTMPAADLRSGPTDPGGPASAIADTQFDVKPSEDPDRDFKRTTQVGGPRARDSRAGTAMQGMENLSAPSADAPKIRLVPGKVIPGTRYEIRRWLGEGGMGVVYEVTHTDIERRSALKILRFDLSQQPQMAQVFRDEARAASRLGSPHIVEVYDFGELPDGRLFFAMELLEGTDLVPADDQTTMAPDRLIAILRQVCKGLAKAHDAGVVHRDVKPENIIITDTEQRADNAKIVDFGISAMLAAGGEARAGIAGTPHYMAPEQILGEDFDGRLDVYALGCTAYELMTGNPPFDAEEVDALLKLQVKEPAKPPSEARPDLTFHPDLEAVVMKCLTKAPEERYANMAELEAALCEAQIAAGITTAWDDLAVPVIADEERYQQIVARMPSPHTVEPAKRGWLWPAVAVGSTLAAAGLAAFLAFGRQPTAEEKDMVEQLTIEARDAASKTAWVIPPPHIEGKTTALRKIVELEGVEGKAESMADDRAEELRHEFATTLVGHGNDLWEEAQGIAQRYYIWALAFEDNDHAFERAGIDEIALSRFRKHALAGDFSESERLLSSFAQMRLVEDEEVAQQMGDAVKASIAKSGGVNPLVAAQLAQDAQSAGMDIDELPTKRGSGAKNSGAGSKPRNGAGAGAGSKPASDDGGDDVVIEDDPEVDPEAEVEDPAATAGRKKRRRQVEMGLGEGKVKSNPARSKELTKQADAQRKAGHRNEAKSLYGQAIAANPKNGAAHLGMAQVHFDQAKYDKARKSAIQAVKYAPRNGRAHKVLGDAYYKAFRMPEAEKAYETAQSLGVNVGKRLADVRKKLGK